MGLDKRGPFPYNEEHVNERANAMKKRADETRASREPGKVKAGGAATPGMALERPR